MDKTQKIKGKVFKDLHSAEGMFVMPNAWNAGSACMLEEAGFPAVGTTSAGIAFCLGLPDYEGVLTREAALDETRRIAGAVRVPVSMDAENGYGHTPEEVVETIRRVADTGAVGASIEDYAAAYGTGELYDRVLAVERIEAAAAATASLPFPFTLTARTECYLVGYHEHDTRQVCGQRLRSRDWRSCRQHHKQFRSPRGAMPRRRLLGGAMTLEEWIAESEAERPERALWPSETDARRFRDVWCTGRERLESNAWTDEDAVAYWWLVKANGSTVTVTERDEVLRGGLVPGIVQNRSQGG